MWKGKYSCCNLIPLFPFLSSFLDLPCLPDLSNVFVAPIVCSGGDYSHKLKNLMVEIEKTSLWDKYCCIRNEWYRGSFDSLDNIIILLQVMWMRQMGWWRRKHMHKGMPTWINVTITHFTLYRFSLSILFCHICDMFSNLGV